MYSYADLGKTDATYGGQVTALASLPVGTTFYVHNGGWDGIIKQIGEDDKGVSVVDREHRRISREVTPISQINNIQSIHINSLARVKAMNVNEFTDRLCYELCRAVNSWDSSEHTVNDIGSRVEKRYSMLKGVEYLRMWITLVSSKTLNEHASSHCVHHVYIGPDPENDYDYMVMCDQWADVANIWKRVETAQHICKCSFDELLTGKVLEKICKTVTKAHGHGIKIK